MYRITKREKLIYITLISVILAILLLSVITDVYARYSSTINGTGDIELAKWEFKVNDKKEGEAFDINIKSDSELLNYYFKIIQMYQQKQQFL